MSKTAVVTDSNSGITQSQAKELGIDVVPMPFNIGEKTYYEDIDLNHEQFFKMLDGGETISTSQPSPEYILNLWNTLLKEYDDIVYMPMSSGLSGSCATAAVLAEDFGGRVQVVDNQSISVPLRQACINAKRLAEKGYDAAAIKEIMERDKSDMCIYIMVDTLKYLKKGGRITPAAAALGTLLKIRPVLMIYGEKLDAFAKARTVKQARTMMINAVKKDIAEKIGDPKDCCIFVAHTQNDAIARDFIDEIHKDFPDHSIVMNPLSLSISCHTGPGALGIAWMKKTPELED